MLCCVLSATRDNLLRVAMKEGDSPSPRAKPLRLWLAQVGEERFEEFEHPEQVLERVRRTYRAKGYDGEGKR